MLAKSRTLIVTVLLLALGPACAHHPGKMDAIRRLMASEGYQGALEEFYKIDRDEGNVLYLLEWGLLLHYAGEYAKSNEVFERAEILSEDLYTKSISREAAALLTSDLALEYAPRPYEQVLVNYFRALNYIFLGEKEGALVECRKAVDKLMVYSEEDKRPYPIIINFIQSGRDKFLIGGPRGYCLLGECGAIPSQVFARVIFLNLVC